MKMNPSSNYFVYKICREPEAVFCRLLNSNAAVPHVISNCRFFMIFGVRDVFFVVVFINFHEWVDVVDKCDSEFDLCQIISYSDFSEFTVSKNA